jgi:hypothetical protein
VKNVWCSSAPQYLQYYNTQAAKAALASVKSLHAQVAGMLSMATATGRPRAMRSRRHRYYVSRPLITKAESP